MFFIVCALHCEATPLISALSLRKDNAACPYDTFFSEDNSCVLVISGTGPIAGASATTYLLTLFRFTQGQDFLMNFGSCAGKAPGLYLINKITEDTTGRDFYPDMLYDLSSCGLPASKEKALVTVDHVVDSLPDTDSLYEMEAAGIFQAASRFIPPHRMLFLKYVSDSGADDPKQITREHLTNCAMEHVSTVLSVFDKLKDAVEDAPSIDMDLFLTSVHAFCASETMQHELRQLFTYAAAADIPISEILDSFYESGALPASSKRDGKAVLDELRKRLI